MSYNLAYVADAINSSITALQSKQPMLFQKKENISEKSVSSALLTHLIPYFPDFDVNCEYNRMTDEHGTQIPKRIRRNPNDEEPSRVYPDIIVHQQSNGKNNLLVLELKMQWKNKSKMDDYEKLIGYTTELHYKYGLYLELGEEGIIEMAWFHNGERL